MKLLLVINVDDDVAEEYKNFTVDFDLRGEDEDGDNVSIKYVEDCPLKPIHALKSAGHDYIIYERQYLYKNLEREYELMKEAREYESNISH